MLKYIPYLYNKKVPIAAFLHLLLQNQQYSLLVVGGDNIGPLDETAKKKTPKQQQQNPRSLITIKKTHMLNG